jgi:ATP-dependent DNA helicase RecG
MKASLEKLYKFFKLETERGFDNRAVLGGLEKAFTAWETEARIENIPEDLILAVGERLQGYHRLSEASRQEAVLGIWRRIQRTLGEEIPPLPVLPPLKTAEPTFSDQAKEPVLLQQPELSPKIRRPTVKKSLGLSMPPTDADSSLSALNAPVSILSGVGPKTAKDLVRLGISTLSDLLYFFPRRYIDFSELKPINRLRLGNEVTVIGIVQEVTQRTVKSGSLKITEVLITDGSGVLRVTYFNQPYRSENLHRGAQVIFSGKVEQYLGRLVMNNPESDSVDQKQLNTNRIVPVYSLTPPLTQRSLRKMVDKVVNEWTSRIPEPMPETIRKEVGLLDLSKALFQIHFPDSWETLKASQNRLAFDEIFLLQLGVLKQKRAWNERTAQVLEIPDDWLNDRLANLPYPLTSAQHRALASIRNDLASGHPMNRLLQGDVGSGKTVVAAMAMSIIFRQNAQAALMTPTGILAEQHYNTLRKLLVEDQGLLQSDEIHLMIGATPESEKRDIRAGLEEGKIKVVIGTHALIEGPVQFANLQLVVVDEQHRFGVEQRAILRNKGANPHLLVMTATPIPRSLALTIYGDLDLTIMDELPPGRLEVETHLLYPRERERAYTLIENQIEKGRQAFIIYPLIEEGEANQLIDQWSPKAAIEGHARLQAEIFPRYKVGLLHGRMRPEEKEGVMARFRDGEFHILVSTSVIEVGVDVPNSTVMLIEGANRFGLAQLHQLRGRVGRGEHQSYCLLIPEEKIPPAQDLSMAEDQENERLLAMTTTNDGFKLAELDLQQRGPGEFLGTRQSGYSELRLANLTDLHLIEKAREQVQALFQLDPELEQPENQTLAAALKHFWHQSGTGDIS